MRPIEELARRNHSEISNLKTEIKQKKDLIKTYKKALNKPVFKCHLCSKVSLIPSSIIKELFLTNFYEILILC